MTAIAGVPDLTLERLRDEGLIPAEATAVYLSGSLVAGLGHANSDVDLFVVADERPAVEPSGELRRPLEPTTVPIVVCWFGATRVDTEYWTPGQVSQLVARVADTDLGGGRIAGVDISDDDVDFLYRLAVAQPLVGSDWLAERQRELEGARFPLLLAARAFTEADTYVEDALGLLQSDDPASAVLAARSAFGYTVDGLLAYAGELSPSAKWRARKLARARPAELSWDDYWRIETMRDLDAARPEAWVELVLERCQDITGRIDFLE